MINKNLWTMSAAALLVGVCGWGVVAQDKAPDPGQIKPEDVDVDGIVNDVSDAIADELDRADRGEPRDPQAQREAWQERIQAWQKRAQDRANIREYDQNGDGKLDDVEKANLAADKAEKEKAEKEKLAKAKADFMKAYDTDKSGTLTADEMAAAKKKIGEMITHLNMVVVADEAFRKAKEPIVAPLVSQIRSDLKVNPNPRQGWGNIGGGNWGQFQRGGQRGGNRTPGGR